MEAQSIQLFNPQAQIDRITLSNGGVCYVVDDALLEPERFVAWAAAQGDAFRRVDFNAYPGTYLMPTAAIDSAMTEFFIHRMRDLFDARRLLHMHCRLSMVTLAPEALRPCQWLCHSDNFGLDRSHSIQASVLYLFKDSSLGGTSFYEPARSAAEISQLFADSTALSGETFTQRYGIEPGYIHASNSYLTRIGSIPARWNRMIFYDGSLLHSGDIVSPEKLTADPLSGRLTFNGFFTCRRHAV
ncbi:DUF6445 family protein [Rhodanobacter sp. C03]|uniref:DUF6445 family protein n=1 Tax=Rhodanobacter sp. C03 TaxID=1945858 RepID=UPI0011156CD7|nr:DUF6445 family protein [Rhodanobacter sp. C03]